MHRRTLGEAHERLRKDRAALAEDLLRAPGILLSIPFLRHLGVESVRYAPGVAMLRLVLAPHLENSFGMVHGGVSMTLLDVGMAMAARSLINTALDVSAASENYGVVTVEMKASFLAPGTGILLARGHCLQIGAQLIFCEAELFGAEGALVAKASGTFKPVRRRAIDHSTDSSAASRNPHESENHPPGD